MLLKYKVNFCPILDMSQCMRHIIKLFCALLLSNNWVNPALFIWRPIKRNVFKQIQLQNSWIEHYKSSFIFLYAFIIRGLPWCRRSQQRIRSDVPFWAYLVFIYTSSITFSFKQIWIFFKFPPISTSHYSLGILRLQECFENMTKQPDKLIAERGSICMTH